MLKTKSKLGWCLSNRDRLRKISPDIKRTYEIAYCDRQSLKKEN